MTELKAFGELEKIAIKEVEERIRRDHSSETYGTKVIEAGFEQDSFVVMGQTITSKRGNWLESPGLMWGIQLDAHTGEIVELKFKQMKSGLNEMAEAAEEARRRSRPSGYVARIPRPE